MTDAEKVAAWAADLINRNGMNGNVFDKDKKPMTVEDVLRAADVKADPVPCECNCHYGGSCWSPYPCCHAANIY